MDDSYIFVSESVTGGHPDKLCDQISDALVDEFLRQDSSARADVECALANGVVFVGAHYRSDADVDVAETARRVIEAAGYREGEFNARDCTILTSLNEVTFQPRIQEMPEEPDDDWLDRFVAQHQATVFGYACRQTPELMPVPIQLAHRLARRLDDVRQSGEIPYLLPDAKTQVAIGYDGRRPTRIDAVSIVASADGELVREPAGLADDVMAAVIGPALDAVEPAPDKRTRYLVNHDGVIRAGGPAVHSGLTGRKNAVDSYGEFSRHSGSALSGKDAMRIDRIGAYAARYAAKNVVAAGLADECEVQLSYTIGFAAPVSVHVETFGNGKLSASKLRKRLQKHFEFRPVGILREFGLHRSEALANGGLFRPLACYGQIGRTDLDLPWERVDKVDALTQ